MNTKKIYRLICALVVMLMMSLQPADAHAEIIDDMTVHTEANGDVELLVKFAFQIQFLRNLPQRKTAYSAIYFNVLSTVPQDEWQNYESHRVPPSDLIEDVTVSTKDKTIGPIIQLKLKRTADVTARLGRDGQSLVIQIKPEGVTTGDTGPSGEITEPRVLIPISKEKPIHIPLGGKDGLPVFPDIDEPQQLKQPAVSGANTSEPPSLADQIIKADNEASSLMIQGGNALLTGQTFIALEAFNGILKLPPNKYTEDAQLWMGISRERAGQLAKAISEYNTYLNLYPKGKHAKWINERLAIFKKSQPGLFTGGTKALPGPAQVNSEIQYSEFGSLSMEAYLGASKTTSLAPVGNVMVPTTVSSTDQKSIVTNVSLTARASNNEYDNRLVFQDYYSANYLPGQVNSNRMGSAFYEIKDRVDNYSFKVGRQSGMGGGVMGRFDGIAAGYGISPDYKVNIVAGQLSDTSMDEQPKFNGASLDFGMRSPIGGTFYYIDQTVYGLTDRQAVGGNLRYFEPRFNVMSMFDYDLQFKEINFITVQGTINGGGKGNDYNFLVDRRKSPILDLRNAISGSTVSLTSLIQNGFTTNDLVTWANQRITSTTMAAAGMVNHLNEKWNMGTDASYSITDALAASGLLDVNGNCIDTTVGCVTSVPSTGPEWSVSERLTGTSVLMPRDVMNISVNYSRSETNSSEALQCSDHIDMSERWSLDTTMSLSNSSDSTGGKSNSISPNARVNYKMRDYLTFDSQLGLTWSNTNNDALASSTKSFQDFLSFGFRFDF